MYVSVYHYNVFVYVIDMIQYDINIYIYMYVCIFFVLVSASEWGDVHSVLADPRTSRSVCRHIG